MDIEETTEYGTKMASEDKKTEEDVNDEMNLDEKENDFNKTYKRLNKMTEFMIHIIIINNATVEIATMITIKDKKVELFNAQ